jgi:hypothetical protein
VWGVSTPVSGPTGKIRCDREGACPARSRRGVLCPTPPDLIGHVVLAPAAERVPSSYSFDIRWDSEVRFCTEKIGAWVGPYREHVFLSWVPGANNPILVCRRRRGWAART